MTTKILVGHVLTRLRELPDESIHCVVTSPPYYGLRDYGVEPQVWCGDPLCEHEWGDERLIAPGRNDTNPEDLARRAAVYGTGTGPGTIPPKEQISGGAFCRHCNAWRGSLGLEPDLTMYIDHMVEICREIRRVLRKDGTFWLNIGDSYAGSWGAQSREHAGKHAPNASALSANQIKAAAKRAARTGSIRAAGLKPKDLMLIPSRLAISLCDDGWWVRSDIAWCKRAPMPESCTDRPTVAWEHVFLLTKSAKYFYDQEAMKEEAECDRLRGPADFQHVPGGGNNSGLARRDSGGKRNMRNFWLIGPSPFPEAHFATFPPRIPEICIKAGTSERGVCPKCAAPWARVVKSTFQQTDNGTKGGKKGLDQSNGWSDTPRGVNEAETIGWQPTCGCDAGDPIPATVLEPFFGAGTTGLVADRLQRNCIGIELNPQYAVMARNRIANDAGLFSDIAAQ